MMQVNITLSNKEKRYYFLYLLGLLFFGVLLISVITLYRTESPFNNSDILAIQTLQEKAKFDERQKVAQPLIDSTFNKIEKISVDNNDPLQENEIKYSINDIANIFETVNISDPRKESYKQIAQFYKMYIEDKNIAGKKNENIKTFNKQFEDCTIGFKERKNQKLQKDNALLMKNN
ncbi:type VI secretion system TssO [Epilithonimonas ginsengisoli]|uniref:Type VI secretion system TssO n=1 Tax=Epilithonimonas ginsengisoli TaxID=1245592 RepID=A0ABU4JDI7_9FLAO|nr:MULTISPECIES: type VI secretion system TssO [Chryseobacterium group]MDW8547735.1 type VI secretion system TssO [Epilithonimonas ginsengisoli]